VPTRTPSLVRAPDPRWAYAGLVDAHRRRPPAGIDEQGNVDVVGRRETLIDRQIREAIDDGRFDDLPFQGERIPLEDDSLAGEWALAFHMLKNANVAPPWIEADKDVRRLLERRESILARALDASPIARSRYRRDLEQCVVAINAAIARVNAEAPTDRQHRRPLRLADELARFDAVAGAPGTPPHGE
jgi:DnaJ-like protein